MDYITAHEMKQHHGSYLILWTPAGKGGKCRPLLPPFQKKIVFAILGAFLLLFLYMGAFLLRLLIMGAFFTIWVSFATFHSMMGAFFAFDPPPPLSTKFSRVPMFNQHHSVNKTINKPVNKTDLPFSYY